MNNLELDVITLLVITLMAIATALYIPWRINIDTAELFQEFQIKLEDLLHFDWESFVTHKKK